MNFVCYDLSDSAANGAKSVANPILGVGSCMSVLLACVAVVAWQQQKLTFQDVPLLQARCGAVLIGLQHHARYRPLSYVI